MSILCLVKSIDVSNEATLFYVSGQLFKDILDRIRDKNNLSGIVPFEAGDAGGGYFRQYSDKVDAIQLRVPSKTFNALINGVMEQDHWSKGKYTKLKIPVFDVQLESKRVDGALVIYDSKRE